MKPSQLVRVHIRLRVQSLVKWSPHVCCESIFIRWHQLLWFQQNALIHGFLNSWFQTLQAKIDGQIVLRRIFIFVVYVNHEIS